MAILFLLGVVTLQQKRKRNDAFAAHRAALLHITGGTDTEGLSPEVEKQVTALAVQNFAAMGYRGSVTHASRFVSQWASRIATQGGCEDQPRSGRPSRLSEEDADRALSILREGYINPDSNCHEWYHSISHARRWNTEFNEIMERCDFSDKVMLRRLQQVCDTLKFKKLRVRKQLTDEQKQERVQCAALLLSVPKRTLVQSYFFIDQKHMFVRPAKREVFLVDKDDLDEGAYVIDPRVWTGKKQETIKLSFYAMVNGKLGPVALTFVTGTTGQPAGNRRVSTRISKVVWMVIRSEDGGQQLATYNTLQTS